MVHLYYSIKSENVSTPKAKGHSVNRRWLCGRDWAMCLFGGLFLNFDFVLIHIPHFWPFVALLFVFGVLY